MMNRRILMILLALVLVISLPVTANAASGESDAQLAHVTDTYGLLTDSEVSSLEAQAAAVSQQYGCSVYILVVRDYTEYSYSTFQFAQDVFGGYQLGWGNDKTGVLLMLSMEGRDYELLFHGDSTDRIFTEYGRTMMEDRFLSCFRNNDFAGGFQEYVSTCAECLQADADGKPIDRQKTFSILFFLPGVFAAMITSTCLYAPMKSAGIKRNANEYIAQGSVELRERTDMFVHRTVTRRPRPQNNSSGGGSHSSHHSGGYSGRSGKF